MHAFTFSVDAFFFLSAVIIYMFVRNRDKQEKADPKRDLLLDFHANLLQAQKERKGMAKIHANQRN